MIHWNLPAHVPLQGEISFEELAVLSGLRIEYLRRVVRFVITLGFFQELAGGRVVHSDMSRLLAIDKQAKAFARHCLFDAFPACVYHIEALMSTDQQLNPETCAFARREGQAFWQALNICSPRLAAFQQGQEFIARTSRAGSIEESFAGLDWSWLKNGESSTIVDVGGGNGQASIALANLLPSVTCICQDLPDVVRGQASTSILEGRVTWQVHDFFQPQPVKGADVYLLRRILHDCKPFINLHLVIILDTTDSCATKGTMSLVVESYEPSYRLW